MPKMKAICRKQNKPKIINVEKKNLACMAGGFVGVWWPVVEPREECRDDSSRSFGACFCGSTACHQTPMKLPALRCRAQAKKNLAILTNIITVTIFSICNK